MKKPALLYDCYKPIFFGYFIVISVLKSLYGSEYIAVVRAAAIQVDIPNTISKTLKFAIVPLLLTLPLLPISQVLAARNLAPIEMPTGEYQLDKENSSVVWKVKRYGLSKYTARFAKIDATLYWNGSDPLKSRVAATVSPVSITTDYPYREEMDFDHELAYSESWFNVKQYDNIRFYSRKLQLIGSNEVKLIGTLEMLGVKKLVELRVRFNAGYREHPAIGKTVMGFSAQGKLHRSEWGMKHLLPGISDEVEIEIEAEFTLKPPRM